jgi:hypothetical protein
MLNDILDAQREVRLLPRLTCKNGLTLSVQASYTHYCTPRQDRGPWTHVEVGFPSVKVEALMPYAEREDKPTDTVYGWVPIELVEQVIQENGGLA